MATPLTAVVSPRGSTTVGVVDRHAAIEGGIHGAETVLGRDSSPKPLPAVTLLGGLLVTTNCVATPGGVTSMALVVAEISPLDTSR